MTPLTATDLHIAELLRGGVSAHRILAIGRHRGTRTGPAWGPHDIAYVRSWLADRHAERHADPPPPPDNPVRLSPRMTLACELIVGGATDEEIARRMGVRNVTARTYRDRVAGRLGVPAAQIARAVTSGRVAVEGIAS